MSSGPTIGWIVHYKSYGTPGGEYQPQCRAAIVTDVRDPFEAGLVSLAVLNPTGLFFDQSVMYDDEQRGGTWHWVCARTEDET